MFPLTISHVEILIHGLAVYIHICFLMFSIICHRHSLPLSCCDSWSVFPSATRVSLVPFFDVEEQRECRNSKASYTWNFYNKLYFSKQAILSKRDLCEPGTKDSWLVYFINWTKIQEQAKSLEVDLHLLLLLLSLFFLLVSCFWQGVSS